MATKPTNDNDRVVVESGTPTGTGPVPPPPPLDGTTNNNNEEKVITTLVTTGPPNMMLTGSDVAAICKIVTHPINDEERQFIRRMKTYLAEQGGSDAILQRCSEAAGGGGGGQSGPGTAERTGTDVDDGSTNNINCLLLDHGRIDTSNPTGTVDDGAATSPTETKDFGAGRLLGIYTTTTDGINQPPSSTTSDPPIFIEVLSYLDEKSLIEASFVNKPWNAICHSPTMKHAIVPYVQLTLDLSSGLDGITTFVRNMKIQFEERELLKNKYQRFELHLIGNRPGGYGLRPERKRMCNAIDATSQTLTKRDEYFFLPYDEKEWFSITNYDEYRTCEREFQKKFLLAIDEMAHTICMDGIVSLVIKGSSNDKYGCYLDTGYWRFFSKLFPQLRDLNIFDMKYDMWAIQEHGFDEFFYGNCQNFPHLTKVVFHTKDRQTAWDGIVEQDYWSGLKEIYIDDLIFVFNSYEGTETMESMPFLELYSSDFKVLERLSIRNARYAEDMPNSFYATVIQRGKIPQDDLVKFVRNAPPALKWFRSDLSQENIRMLKFEKPNIEFVN